jgi:TRAP-type uncharacterized transport system fused permease subunit
MEKPKVQQNKEVDEGAREAQKIAEEAEFGSRRLSGAARYIIPCIAAAWSLFQLSLPEVLILDSVYVRAIHLAFAIMLVYLSHPAFKKIETRGILSFLSVKNRIHFIDYGLGIIAAYAALYIALNYSDLAGRQGAPITMDIVVGVVLVVLLLEAARRSLGPFLVIVACGFIFL